MGVAVGVAVPCSSGRGVDASTLSAPAPSAVDDVVAVGVAAAVVDGDEVPVAVAVTVPLGTAVVYLFQRSELVFYAALAGPGQNASRRGATVFGDHAQEGCMDTDHLVAVAPHYVAMFLLAFVAVAVVRVLLADAEPGLDLFWIELLVIAAVVFSYRPVVHRLGLAPDVWERG